MVDLAIGVIIGGAFGKIVTSLVNDVVSPAGGAYRRSEFYRRKRVGYTKRWAKLPRNCLLITDSFSEYH